MRLVGVAAYDVLDQASVLGITTIVEPHVDPSRWRDRDGIAEVAAELNRWAKRARERSISIGYHNHGFELRSRIGGVSGLEVLADLLDDNAVLELDVFWVELVGVSAVDLLRRLGERVSSLHLKDAAPGDAGTQVPLGQGSLPLLDVLRAAPTAHRVVAPDSFAGEPLEDLAVSLEFLVHAEEVRA